MTIAEQFDQTINYIRKQYSQTPEIAIVLGTGMGKLANMIEVEKSLAYNFIPNFPISTVESHFGKLIFGTLSGKRVVAMQGRFHYYEGYSMFQITYPIRIFKLLGINTLLLSNAAGGLNPDYRCGHFMILDDHINLLPENPLRGSNLDTFGPRFPDMSGPYNKKLIDSALKIGRELGMPISTGVYAAVSGPNLETRAENRYLKGIGADAVGMSTVPEAIVANHMGMRTFAISVITDECALYERRPVLFDEILHVAGEAEPKLSELFSRLIAQID